MAVPKKPAAQGAGRSGSVAKVKPIKPQKCSCKKTSKIRQAKTRGKAGKSQKITAVKTMGHRIKAAKGCKC